MFFKHRTASLLQISPTRITYTYHLQISPDTYTCRKASNKYMVSQSYACSKRTKQLHKKEQVLSYIGNSTIMQRRLENNHTLLVIKVK